MKNLDRNVIHSLCEMWGSDNAQAMADKYVVRLRQQLNQLVNDLSPAALHKATGTAKMIGATGLAQLINNIKARPTTQINDQDQAAMEQELESWCKGVQETIFLIKTRHSS